MSETTKWEINKTTKPKAEKLRRRLAEKLERSVTQAGMFDMMMEFGDLFLEAIVAKAEVSVHG